MLLTGFAYRGFSLVLPAAFQSQTTFVAGWLERLRFESLGGLRNLAATTLASVAYAVGMAARLAGGHLADRHDLRRMYLGFHLASLPFLNEAALVAAACGYVFFALGMQPLENSLVARFTPARWRSTG